MSRLLYYSTCSFYVPRAGVFINDILDSRSNGDEIIWSYCESALSTCEHCIEGFNSYCKFCRLMYKQYGFTYGKGVKMIPINRKQFTHKEHSWSFENDEQIRSIVYRNVNIGMSILSTYYSHTRDLDLINLDEERQLIETLVSELCDFTDFAYDFVDRIKPDKIIVFNGRFFESRLFYDIANTLGIGFKSMEVLGGFSEPYYKVSFDGDLPHSIKIHTKKIENLWNNPFYVDPQKTEIASMLYTGRRAGKLVADVKVYTENQKADALPADFDATRCNIAIFNSSPDEFAALGGEWDSQLFPSQYDAIEFILQNSPSSLHYYLRIHPNLKGMNYKAHMDLYKLSRFNNMTIIPPDSVISTYSLLDVCDKVITFGSTMGVEATFWGKPSILLGKAVYENMDVCYVVRDKSDIMPLLTQQLKPKDKLGALKCGLYRLDRQIIVDKTSIDINSYTKKFRWEFRFSDYFRLLGSQVLYQVVYFYYCILLHHFEKPKFKVRWNLR